MTVVNVTVKNKSIKIDTKINVGDALDFEAVNQKMKLIRLSKHFKNNKKIISVIPSIDTGICQLQTKKFYEWAAKELQDFDIITISKDLPFAQNRFCSNMKHLNNFFLLSDYRNLPTNFENVTGLLIQELALLARAVLVLDENNKIIYFDIMSNVGNEPDYDKLAAFIKKSYFNN